MRTSWNVGLATGAAEPVPRATPRTKVVFPAPSSPLSRTRSPVRRRRPSSSPAASVSSAAEVSRKVVVAEVMELQRGAVCTEHLDRGVVGEIAEWLQSGATDGILRPNANQLGLLTACQGLLERCTIRDRNLGGADHGTRARKGDELVHLAQEAVGNITAAEPRRVQLAAFGEKRLQSERPALAKGDGSGPEGTGDRH